LQLHRDSTGRARRDIVRAIGGWGAVFQRLGIEPGEGRVFAWGAATLALAGWADASVKNASETFFLDRVGYEYLPLAYLINSVLLVGTTYYAGLVASRSDRPRLLPRVFIGLSILLVPIWLLVRAEMISAFVLLVLASKQFQSIALLAYWQAMGDLLNGRQAKRLFAPMMAGYTIGTIVGSFASEPIGSQFGVSALLPVAAIGFAMSGLLSLPLRDLVPRRLGRSPATPQRASQRTANHETGLRELLRESQLFRLLFIGALASGLVGPMLYFQFQYVVSVAADGEQGVLKLLARVHGATGGIVLATQLIFTSRLFRRLGIPLSIVMSPAVYLFGFLGMSVRLNLTAGGGAFAATKLWDAAIYDPAMRILFNLFPERVRSRATGLLEGPVKRAGGAIGNVLSMAAVYFASAIAVGYVAIPIAAAWLVAMLALWRRYPSLLLRASASRARHGDDFDVAEMIDANTLRELGGHLVGEDPGPAIELISEAAPTAAAGALAAAAREAPHWTRPQLIAALDRILEGSVTEPVHNAAAAANLVTVLEASDGLEARDRADVVQAYGRLMAGDPAAARDVLEGALGDESAGVRLAAAAALNRTGSEGTVEDLDARLAHSINSSDLVERRIAREELRANLLAGEPGAAWETDFSRLAKLLDNDGDRADAAEAVADVARRHGATAALAAEAMLAHREDPDPRVRAALLRFCGRARLSDTASWLVEHLSGSMGTGSSLSLIAEAARDGLVALGSDAADVLLVELSFAKRRTRDAILPIIRQLEVEEKTLRDLFERELQATRRKLVQTWGLRGQVGSGMVVQRLRERTEEGLHTTLLLLAAIHDSDRIAQLGDLLKHVGASGSGAILIEALDALLEPHEKSQLMPLMADRPLELRARSAAAALGVRAPEPAAVIEALLEDSDELTRVLTAATLSDAVAVQADVEDHERVLSPVEIALHLKSLPLFDGLTTRQLMDLAEEVREEFHAPGTVVIREGDEDDCLYLIVSGTVKVMTGDTQLGELGPKRFFGEIAVLQGERRTATVETLDRVRLLRLDRVDLLRLMEELPAIAICICQALSKKVQELTERVRPTETHAAPDAP
jgi:AAA family ATP:ADP antiporter